MTKLEDYTGGTLQTSDTWPTYSWSRSLNLFTRFVRAVTQVAGLALAVMFLSTPASADETIVYTYDALGRLVATSTTGTINSGQSVSTNFDPVGNRSSYTVNGVVAANLAITSATITEGGTLVFTVTRSGNTASTVTVNYASANVTAVAGSDYTAASGTLTFAPNETTKTISIATLDDAIAEPTETLTVALSGASTNASISVGTATGTINDNDVSPANLSVSGASVAEGGTLVFTVTRSGNTTIAAGASYMTVNGSALAGSDYLAASGGVNFAANQTTATISVATVDDAAVEPIETMTVTLSSPMANTTIVAGTATGTITDNDVATVISLTNNPTVNEGGNLVFTLSASPAPNSPLTVSYATVDGTATAPANYLAQSGTVTFAAGQTTQSVTITTVDDKLRTGALTMSLNLSAPPIGGTIGTGTAIGTITNTTPLVIVAPLTGYTVMVLP